MRLEAETTLAWLLVAVNDPKQPYDGYQVSLAGSVLPNPTGADSGATYSHENEDGREPSS